MNHMYRILVLNLGSTSTKLAYFENQTQVYSESVTHHTDSLKVCGSNVLAQKDIRKNAVLEFMERNDIDLQRLDAIISRGGQTEAIPSGLYRINDAMIEQNDSGKYGIHICGVGLRIADEIAREYGIEAFTADTPSTDEFEPIARISGLKDIERRSSFQALNHKAMAQYFAECSAKRYEDMNLIVVMLGGGISVVAHRKGRMIDGPDALEGEGPFSNNRTGSLPVGALVKICFSGQYTKEEMMHKINGEGGLMSYLDTMDIRGIEKRICDGDSEAQFVMEAMCYQTAKEIGACATVLKGEVDAILMIGGMANSKYLTGLIEERVRFIAPVVILPGEREMESLGKSADLGLTKKMKIQSFVPIEAK